MNPYPNWRQSGPSTFSSMEESYSKAVLAFSDIIESAMKRHNLSKDDVSWIVPRKRTPNVKAVSKRVGIDYEKFIVTVGSMGTPWPLRYPWPSGGQPKKVFSKRATRLSFACWSGLYPCWWFDGMVAVNH